MHDKRCFKRWWLVFIFWSDWQHFNHNWLGVSTNLWSKLYSQENVLSDPDVYLIDLIYIFFSSFCIVQHLHCTYQNYVFLNFFFFNICYQVDIHFEQNSRSTFIFAPLISQLTIAIVHNPKYSRQLDYLSIASYYNNTIHPLWKREKS